MLYRRQRFRQVFRFRSPLLTKSRLISFPPGTKMFQFPGYRPLAGSWVTSTGFPHSEIDGSMLVYNSPSLIAANHVLLRLSMPWHPPYALNYLTILLSKHDKSCFCVRNAYLRYKLVYQMATRLSPTWLGSIVIYGTRLAMYRTWFPMHLLPSVSFFLDEILII